MSICTITFDKYQSELQMPDLMTLIQKDLSEPYSIYTYRYFIHNWSNLCFLAYDESIKKKNETNAETNSECIGAIVCKLELGKGYIAMLVVKKEYRRHKIGSELVKLAVAEMQRCGAGEVVLETEVTNHSALRLYEKLGFVRDKRLFKYYLNGLDALRLKLWML